MLLEYTSREEAKVVQQNGLSRDSLPYEGESDHVAL